MIKGFGSLYAGHVDLGNIGLAGTPVNERNFSNEHLSSIFDRVTKIVKRMDDLGYHSFWAAEHHFQREGNETIPNLLLLYVHLAHITRNIKLACGFNISPMWHPLRLAEDYATADILTGGRVIFGVGRGYHSREVATFGVPSTDMDSEANREVFEEQVEIIMKAFHEDSFSHHGKHYDLPPEVPYRGYTLKEITLVPRPINPIETWQPMVSAGQRSLDFMAKHNIQAIVGGGAVTGGPSNDVIKRWTETLVNHGHTDAQLGSRLIIGLPTFIADSEKEALDQARKYFEEDMKMFGPLGFFQGFTPEMLNDLGDPKRAPTSASLPSFEDTVAAGAWLCGTAEHITEKIMEIQDSYPGLEYMHVGCVRQGTPLEVMLEQLERFAKEVMPNFNVETPSGP